MRFHSANFFCVKGKNPKIIIDVNDNEDYPIILSIGHIDIFLGSVLDLFKLKESLLSEFERLMKKDKE